MNPSPVLPLCPLHKTQPLNWVCLENNCETRLFCSHCIIFNHKDVHRSFNEITHILKDPLSQLLPSNHLKNSSISDSLLEIITKFSQEQEDLLTDIYNSIITEISLKFDDIRKAFHDDLVRFIEKNQSELDNIDLQRKEYLNFSINYFTNTVYETRESLKEGLDLILNKFHSDNNLQKMFEDTIKAIPQVNFNRSKIKEIAIGNRKLEDIKWSFFTNKGINFDGESEFWTFDPTILPIEFDFSNNNMTLKSKNNIAYFTTLIGNKSLTSGVHNWSVSVDQISGAFVCFGILPVQMNINYKTNYYTQAYCVCSDKYVYNMVKFAGEITNGINSGDILECVLNFEEDFFKIKNGDSFEYTAKNVKGKEFYPYFGFSAFNATQLSLLF